MNTDIHGIDQGYLKHIGASEKYRFPQQVVPRNKRLNVSAVLAIGRRWKLLGGVLHVNIVCFVMENRVFCPDTLGCVCSLVKAARCLMSDLH